MRVRFYFLHLVVEHGALGIAGLAPNNSFNPNPLRSTNNTAGKACHVAGSTTQVGLTQALGLAHRLLAAKASRQVVATGTIAGRGFGGMTTMPTLLRGQLPDWLRMISPETSWGRGGGHNRG
jgi:hypothetical protein